MEGSHKSDAGNNDPNNVYEEILKEKEDRFKDEMLQSFSNKTDVADTSVKANKTEGEDNDNLSKEF